MERRVLLAVFLSFLVLVIYQRLVEPPPLPVDQTVAPAANPVGARPDGAPIGSGGGAATSAGVQAPAVEARPAPVETLATETFEPTVFDSADRDIVVETEFVRAVFANRGAELISWQLKRYGNDSGGYVELIPPDVAPDQAWPFTLVVPGDPELTARLDRAVFRPSVDQLRLVNESGTLVFEYEDSSGLRARKSFAFQSGPAQPYVVGFHDQRAGSADDSLGSGPGRGTRRDLADGVSAVAGRGPVWTCL